MSVWDAALEGIGLAAAWLLIADAVADMLYAPKEDR